MVQINVNVNKGAWLTIIESGEPYMMTENMEAAKPQKTFLGVPCRAKRDTKTTIENTESTAVKKPKILSFSFLGANMMNIKTYMISIAAPAPFTVDTSKLWGDTKGKPYLWLLEVRRD
jgi:hypothetical protein